jgi:hypothetical protein
MPTQPLTPEQKANWNRFIDFVAAQKMTGSPLLDQRNKQVGMSLLQKFNYANPKYALPTDIVPVVQQNLQDYRTNLVNQYKAGKIAASPDIKSEADIMAHISPVDGWPGTRTLSSKFPVAKDTKTTPTSTTVTDYGTDVDAFDKSRGLVKK